MHARRGIIAQTVFLNNVHDLFIICRLFGDFTCSIKLYIYLNLNFFVEREKVFILMLIFLIRVVITNVYRNNCVIKFI